MDEGPADRPGRRMLWRSLAAALLIVLLTAGATSTAAFLQIDRILPDKDDPDVAPPIVGAPVDKPYAGKPQTILLLGSDKRWADEKDDARSDTMMLVRLDPDQTATTVLSIPRDLKVMIPGHGFDKMNEAYRIGGPALTIRTIKELTGLRINHVANVNFKGFRRVVELFDCFYVDVDRRYFHSNEGVPVGQRYAEIDLKPGYQPLCGRQALDYVRHRHADNDLVRAARQQDFLRAAKDQIDGSAIIEDREKLAKAFWRAAQTDENLRTLGGFTRLLPLALGSAGNPVRQLSFPAEFAQEPYGQGVIDYVIAAPEAIDETVERFLNGGADEVRPRAATKRKVKRIAQEAELVDARAAGRAHVAPIRKRGDRAGLSVRFPTFLTPDGRYADKDGVRLYGLRDRDGTVHRAYRLVVQENEVEGQYYGVQGTTWPDPPLLASPSETRVVQGRTLELFRSGRRLRFVAWRTSRAVYWISNTLNLKLDNDTMTAMAASLTTRTG
jgi:LCP family protein required for cell wall assembly